MSFHGQSDILHLVAPMKLLQSLSTLLILRQAVIISNFGFNFSATVGLQYRVQYKTALKDFQWQTLGSDVTATAASVSVSDSITNLQRFYRVVQLN